MSIITEVFVDRGSSVGLEEAVTPLRATLEEDVARTQEHLTALGDLTDSDKARALIILYSGLYDAKAGRETCRRGKRSELDKQIRASQARIDSIYTGSRADTSMQAIHREVTAWVDGIFSSYEAKGHSRLSPITATAHDLRKAAKPFRVHR